MREMSGMRMIRWNTFAAGLLFAALAAGGVLPWLLVAKPISGAYTALALYLVAALAAYVALIAPERSRGFVALLVTLAAGIAVAGAARSITELALGLGVVLAVARSGFLYGRSPARAVVLETFLVAGGLLFARFLAGHSALALVLAVWGFFLVQSFYFLAGEPRRRESSGRHPDAFEDACGRALALLDR